MMRNKPANTPRLKSTTTTTNPLTFLNTDQGGVKGALSAKERKMRNPLASTPSCAVPEHKHSDRNTSGDLLADLRADVALMRAEISSIRDGIRSPRAREELPQRNAGTLSGIQPSRWWADNGAPDDATAKDVANAMPTAVDVVSVAVIEEKARNASPLEVVNGGKGRGKADTHNEVRFAKRRASEALERALASAREGLDDASCSSYSYDSDSAATTEATTNVSRKFSSNLEVGVTLVEEFSAGENNFGDVSAADVQAIAVADSPKGVAVTDINSRPEFESESNEPLGLDAPVVIAHTSGADQSIFDDLLVGWLEARGINDGDITYVDCACILGQANGSISADALEAMERSGGCREFPQLFVHGRYVGCFSELESMLDNGGFDDALHKKCARRSSASMLDF
jgi:hypothetical protein